MAWSSASARTSARGVAGLRAEVLDRHGQRQELAERIPAQVVLLHELLHVLRRRAAGAGLVQPAAVEQRHDRQHLGARAELENREQIREVVAQHVAGDRDRVEAGAHALQRRADRVDRRHDLDVETRRVVVLQVRAAPSRSRSGRRRGCSSSQKIAAWPVARARLTASFTQSLIGRSRVRHMRQMSPASTGCSKSARPDAVDDADRAGRGNLERLVVRAVLLGGLRHQPDVRHRAHRRDVERAVLLCSRRWSPDRCRRTSDRESSPSCRAACRRVPTSDPTRGSRPASRRR